ncbi:calcium-translocating P-type ATPase, SERCA-type [Marininema halotolerans]|uniref:P-type Ca(2+) transporter n=1 Tax=Marininema halotolerans TaxID=1155944 RepID=A0A1I6QDK1_9BACL|nr:calcium-translocating P-type ATPase, SERCA-type [Marininema halotolerans]SFS50573.1 Ca2+-transporting ATPase [Marininema halotolerans]
MSEGYRYVDWDVERVASHFKVEPAEGLDDAEASRRLEQTGPNQLAEAERISPVVLLLNQFKDFMVLVLLAATLISGLLGEYTDAIAIIAIVILNAVLGFVQEVRAEKSLSALRELSAPTARVMRNGEWVRIQAAHLVPGDIVSLESGDRIPADLRLIQTSNMYIEESALTGESVPTNKTPATINKDDVPLGDQKNMAFLGTMVVRGTGLGIVVHTGMETEMGRIAHLIQTTETMQTPLQRRLEQLGKVLIIVALLLTAVVVVTGIIHGHDAYKMFLAGVSLAVAAIPEGLPAIVTIALALGVQRMIKRQAIVRKLPSVETLGCASIICSDKTGTLTQNKMTVTHLWVDRHRIELSGSGYQPEGNFLSNGREVHLEKEASLKRLLEVAVLCNNARLIGESAREGLLRRKQEKWRIDGDPTEGALLVAGAKGGLGDNGFLQSWQRIQEFPFDSERKMMSVLMEHRSGKRVLFTKGGPDVLLERCTHILQNGRTVPLTESLRAEVIQTNEALAKMALRNLAFAYRDWQGASPNHDRSAERNLVFVGLAGMIDPPREEVKDAIRTCRRAGIRTVMITGDHQTTAVAIAQQLGILQGGETINGSEIQQMSDEEFSRKAKDIHVYARVSPEHKLRIVKALQEEGHVVAMTGDGVNDAPAIKAADIGIAMGVTGTDVSKEASSLVLADDNFATIVAAIEEGRNIYDNIRKFISYLLASNVGEILVMFLAMLAGLPLPLVPIQILWVNLVTDGLPAMALGVDPAEEDTMDRDPRNSRENIFAAGVGWKILTRGLLIGLCTLGAFWVAYSESPDDLVRAQTIAFSTLVMAQLIYVFDCRSSRTVFHRNPLSNPLLVLAVVSSAVLMIGVMYYPPLQPVFHTTALAIREWALVIVAAALPTMAAGALDMVLPLRRMVTRTER